MLLTGHTGFKGGWLAIVLAELGAEVHGLALPPSTMPNLFSEARVSSRIASSRMADIRDPQAVGAAVRESDPDVVFHLAAQALVRAGYRDPMGTFGTNVMGTVNVLEALRASPSTRAVVCVTSDKVYASDGAMHVYAEGDPLGGPDPYSGSKSCAELAAAAYRRSFLEERGIGVATARAGNVIGGGDWAADRLIPDFVRALQGGEVLSVRSPQATRPWQHVLDPLAGYLRLAEVLLERPRDLAGAWNFGPIGREARTVEWVVRRLCAADPRARWRAEPTSGPPEATTLTIDSSKARDRLAWRPKWPLEEAIDRTIAWHCAHRDGQDMLQFCLRQIAEHEAAP